jgi:hypothetical protein
MKFDELNEENYIIFAIKHYENPQAVTQEDFFEDMKRFKWIKRLLNKYKNTGELNNHLIINHFMVLYNVFGEATTPMLFFKIEKDLWSSMKSFVIFLGRFPEYPKSSIHDIEVDVNCLSKLYKIYNGKEET